MPLPITVAMPVGRSIGRSSSCDRSRTIAEVGGVPLLDLVWGDVENYQQGQERFGADDVVLRFVRRVDNGGPRLFQVTAVSAGAPRDAPSVSVTDGDQRPDTFTFDLRSTAWAD